MSGKRNRLRAAALTCVLDVGGNPSVRSKEPAEWVHYFPTQLVFIPRLLMFHRFWTTSTWAKNNFRLTLLSCVKKKTKKTILGINRMESAFFSCYLSRSDIVVITVLIWRNKCGSWGLKEYPVTPLVVANPPWMLQCKPHCAPGYTCSPLCLSEERTEEV